MTRRAERLFITLNKCLIAACSLILLLALFACSCRDWGSDGYCPPPLAPMAG